MWLVTAIFTVSDLPLRGKDWDPGVPIIFHNDDKRYRNPEIMAKSDSFFIRATVTPDNSGTFVQNSVDLGSYVSALGKSVLRIHNIEQEWTQGPSGTIPGGAPTFAGDKAGYAIFQLTTQSQTGLITLDNKSCIAKGQIWARNADSAVNPPGTTYSDSHMPQHYSNGYLVAVETMYLGAQADTDWTAGDDITCAVVMECSVETLSQAAAMALSLSQQ